MPLRDYQVKLKADTYAAWQSGARNVLTTLPTGGGKCLGRGTPVLMHDGTVRAVETIQPGERVMGPDSKPRTVASTCSGVEPLYRVKPTKGEPYVVNESHILSLRKTGGSEVVNVDVRAYLAQNKTFKHAHKGWRTGVNWRSRLVPDVLPPYLLGLWLGDGSAKCAAITTADPEVVDYLQAYCSEREWVLRTEVLPDNKANTYFITNRRKRIGSLPETMRALGLFDAKHVPPLYKVNDRETRLEVLAGLLDSDGYLHHGHYDAVFKSEQLADDLAFLSRSVGLAAYVRPCIKGATNSPTGKTGTYYRVSISGDVDMIPTRLPRHQPAPRRQIKNVLNVGIELEPLGPGEYFGFELDGPDRLFLLGDFTVTHNTVVKAAIVEELNDAACCIAHRRELVGQISLAMAREGVRHRIIAPDPIIKWCARMQVDRVGRSLVYPNAQVAVAGVDTLMRPHPELKHWAKRVALWVQDEAHHVLRENKWGRALELFPNAKGLGVTATPGRADGKGLGRHAHGVFDTMVEGPGMRDLIRQGYLTEYRIIAPTVHLEGLKAGASGDFTDKSIDEAIGKSRLIGDIVPTWERYARGKKTVVFAHNLKAAGEIADEFNAHGWRAAVISSKNDDQTRVALVCKFERGDLDVLVNVDLFGEGFDLPAIECVVFARPTASLGLYMQQFGRVLRLLDGKLFGIVIDHVGNIMRHGLPDRSRVWTLDAREKRKSDGADDAIPLRTCGNVECLAVYERIHKQCPYCSHAPEPAERSGPQHVDGDLGELDPAVLARMRGESDRVLLTPEQVAQEIRDKYGPPVAQHAAAKNHIKWQWAQAELRGAIEQWCGYRKAEGHDDSTMMRLFYFTFGVDILSAQGIRSITETNNLTARIRAAYTNG